MVSMCLEEWLPLFCKGNSGVPHSLIKDGDLLATIYSVFKLKGWTRSKVLKLGDMVANQFMVDDGSVRHGD